MTEGTIATIKQLDKVEQNGERVLTTAQLAQCYGTDTNTIKVNFNRNKNRYKEGRHYICLKGEDLQEFKNRVTDCNLVGSRANILYLWTEHGILLHAKSLNTDKAWEVYENLIDFYFRSKEFDNTALVQKVDCLEATITLLQNQLADCFPKPNYDAIEKWKEQIAKKRVAKLMEKTELSQGKVYALIYGAMERMFGFVTEVAISNYAHKYNLFDGKDEPIIDAIADNEVYQNYFIQATDKIIHNWKIHQIKKEEREHIKENDSVIVHIDKELILHRPFTMSDDFQMIFDSVGYAMGNCQNTNALHGKIYREMYTKAEWAEYCRKYNQHLKGSSTPKYLLINNVKCCKQRFVDVCNRLTNEYRNKED